MSNALLDSNFLKQLDLYQHKVIYGKIIAFDNQGKILGEITGQINSGSISVDGNSAVRRSCNLTLSYNTNVNIHWALMNRFKLYIGVNNNINPIYESIIWFPQGYYVATSYSCSKNLNSISISLQGKDKMCLLNGDVSGNIPYGITVNKYRDIENNEDKDLTIRDMIYYLVAEIGKEDLPNIIINDLADYGLELIRNNTENNLYIRVENALSETKYSQIYNYIPSGQYFMLGGALAQWSAETDGYITYYEANRNNNRATKFYDNADTDKYHYFYRVLPGDTCGYRETPLIWPADQGDLVLKAGDTIASALSKITQVFGNYEFFYDVEGRFIVQQIPTYTQVGFAGNMTTTGLALQSKYSYEFNGETLVQSISNSPKIANIKNDFSIWGKHPTGIDFCLRYAIDTKPTSYYSQKDNRLYTTSEVDWRELIYLMARDFYTTESNIKYKNKTGYEQYYADLYQYWYYDNGKTIQKLIDIPIYDRPYWIDFLEAGNSELGQYNIQSIGDRLKATTNDKLRAISYNDIPDIIFTLPNQAVHIAGYQPLVISEAMMAHLDISTQGKTAYDELNSLLYQYTYSNASISIKAIPIYYLSPNTLIYLYDQDLNINGDYKIDKITYSFNYNGLMDITAVEIPKNIY